MSFFYTKNFVFIFCFFFGCQNKIYVCKSAKALLKTIAKTKDKIAMYLHQQYKQIKLNDFARTNIQLFVFFLLYFVSKKKEKKKANTKIQKKKQATYVGKHLQLFGVNYASSQLFVKQKHTNL